MHSVYTKSLWEARRSYWWWMVGLGALGAMMTMFYPMLAENTEAFQEMFDLYPEGFRSNISWKASVFSASIG